MSGSDLEALLDFQVVGWPSRMSGSGQEALPEVRKWSEDTPGCPGVVGTPSQMSECSGGPPGCLVVIGRPSRMSGSGREALPYVG